MLCLVCAAVLGKCWWCCGAPGPPFFGRKILIKGSLTRSKVNFDSNSPRPPKMSHLSLAHERLAKIITAPSLIHGYYVLSHSKHETRLRGVVNEEVWICTKWRVKYNLFM